MQASQRFDTRQLSHLSASLQRHMAQYGYHAIETPIIQPADLFLTRAGDQIIDHLFTFERRGQQYALRPEFTASAAALYAQQCDEGTVARWQFSGSIFEDDPAVNVNSYQRYGIGAELLGMAGPLAEAEIIAMAAQGLSQHGIQDWVLIIGNVQLMRHLLATFHLDSRVQRFLLSHLPALKNPDQGKPYVLEILDKLVLGDHGTVSSGAGEELNTQQLLDVLLNATQRGGTMGGRTRQDIVRRLLQKRQRAAEHDQFVKALDFLDAWCRIDAAPEGVFDTIEDWIAPDDATAQAIFANWRRLLHMLDAYGIDANKMRLQPALARNWDYYTGIVFELHTSDGCQLGGGGRYDELARLLGADHEVPAVGFTYYADQLAELLPQQPEKTLIAFTIVVTPEVEAEGVRWSHILRQQGYTAKVLSTDSISTQDGIVVGAQRTAPLQPPISETTAEEVVLRVQPDGAIEWESHVYPLTATGNFIAHLENR